MHYYIDKTFKPWRKTPFPGLESNEDFYDPKANGE